MGGLTLVLVGLLLRRVLRIGEKEENCSSGFAPLRGDLEAVYEPVAHEIEAHAAILGITLNEAFNERGAKRHEMAWHVVRLAVGEWDRLDEFVESLLDILGRFLPSARGIAPVRPVAVSHFKSRAAADNAAFYEFLDQILFSSRGRFALRLRSLHKSNTLVSKGFRRACREGALTLDASDELWARLDHYFHDVDLIAKETLLAFQTLLLCQTRKGVQELALELDALLERAARVSVYPSR